LTGQLAFDLPTRTTHLRADFFASPTNTAALAAISAPGRWPEGRMILLGPEGSGKTHLAHLWASENGGTVIAATDLAAADLPSLAAGPVVVEDVDSLPRPAETPLFHLHNLLAGIHPLLITATSPPRDWGHALPDLVSRMQAMPITRIDAPDDALLAVVLVKLFADRQITVAPNLIAYLIPRMDRSLHAASLLVAALDARALALGRPVTRALATELTELNPKAPRPSENPSPGHGA
jgi:chromosomal replication initiation ATPase DnaA